MKHRRKPQNRLDRRESKLLAKSKYFRTLVLIQDPQEIKEGKVSRWKDVWGKL